MSSISFRLHIVQSLPGSMAVPHARAQLVALFPLLNSPIGQWLHTRSAVADGVFDTKVLAPQMAIAVHALALDVVLKVSPVQTVHSALLLLVGAALT